MVLCFPLLLILSEQFRELSRWPFIARYRSNYGVTDVLCNFAGQSEVNSDLHFMALDVLYPELIEPESGANLPWKEGEKGELVLTHLCKEAQPLIRFRTHDIIQITGTGQSPCGRSTPRFRVIGRSDDMVVVRGINVFPTMVAEILNQIEDLSGEYHITLTTPPPYDYLPVDAELKTGQNSSPTKEEVAVEIKKYLGVTAKVALMPANSFPRVEGKTKRVIKTF